MNKTANFHNESLLPMNMKVKKHFALWNSAAFGLKNKTLTLPRQYLAFDNKK
jgi:hypothetical protein